MNSTLENIDNELIFDTEHIIMNYLKMNNFNPDCLKDTNIQISNNIYSNKNNPEYISSSNKFASKYFLELSTKDNIIDLFSPLISNYPNSELGLFLAVLLKKHVIDISNNLNSSVDLFQKYKNDILSIYSKVLPQKKKQKLLENICASITVLIIIGFQGQWTNGIDQLISAAKSDEGKTENNLIASLILSNIDHIFVQLETKLEQKSSDFILSLIDSYSCVVNDYICFLIQNSFSGDKQNFVNGDLFKAFIGVIHCFKYFKINIIQIHGFLDFLINCTSYIDINQDFITEICDLFDDIFKAPDKVLKYDYDNNFKRTEFNKFLIDIQKNEDFQEIFKCIKLIHNVKNYYSNKDINEIKNNPKDMQILFASCNIFNSICENYGYIFILPEIDDIVQEIHFYFINLPIFKINQLLLSSLNDFVSLSQNDYKFENYENNIRENKKNKLNEFLYAVQNSILQNMKLEKEELNLNTNNKSDRLMENWLHLDPYISELLKSNINDDEKSNFIENSKAFYEDIYNIIRNLFDINDYCDKLCKYLLSSTETSDYVTVDCLMNIFNQLYMEIITEKPDIIINMIDFIIQKKDILFKNNRFVLQFFKLIYNVSIQISKNVTLLNFILENLINSNVIKDLNCEVLNDINIILINRLCLYSYQNYKLSEDDNPLTVNNKDLNNIFNILSKFLLDNFQLLNHFYLSKLVDAFYSSLFYNIKLNVINQDSIYTATEKLITEANQLYNQNNITINNLLKYIYILWVIIKNIGNESKDILFNLLNKADPFYKESQSYLTLIQNNIINIINSNNNGNFNESIMDAIIILNTTLISFLKEKSSQHFDYFNKIISLVVSLNPKYIKIYSLTYSLYSQIFCFNSGSEVFNTISKIGFDILNSMNAIYGNLKDDNEKVLLASNQTEIILLYIQKSTDFINNLNLKTDIFMQSLNNIINLFDKSNNRNFAINFTNLMNLIVDLSLNNNTIGNLLKENFVEKITKTIINNIQYFEKYNFICIQNCFNIFKNLVGTPMKEKFCLGLNDVYNDKELILIFVKFINYLKNNKNMRKNEMDKKIREFFKDLSELCYAMNKKRNEFIKKYEDIMNNNITNEENMRSIKVNLNSEIHMNLFAQ